MRRVVLVLALAGVALGCARGPLPPIRVAIQPPPFPSPPWGRMQVHIRSEEPVSLVEDSPGGGVSTICVSPCDASVRVGRRYHLAIDAQVVSDAIPIEGVNGAHVTIEVPPIPRGAPRFSGFTPTF